MLLQKRADDHQMRQWFLFSFDINLMDRNTKFKTTMPNIKRKRVVVLLTSSPNFGKYLQNPKTMNTEPNQPKPKTRQRASTPRSKTGCITCKMRRLKCGEEKPHCHRCVKSGWQCDGYDHGLSTPSKASRTPSPRIIASRPSTSLDLTDQERRYFQVFVEQKSTSLDHRDTDSFYWKQTILQDCLENPCVRHAIVAHGALIMTKVEKTNWAYYLKVDPAQDVHHEFSLTQYQKALRFLRTSVTGKWEKGSNRTTLISCLALALFDCFCGNGGFAAQHVRFGRKLLSSSSVFGQQQSNHSTPIDDGLTRMFLRLDTSIICAMGIDNECTYDDLLSIDIPPTSIPEQYSNFDEARQARHTLLFDGYQFFLRTLKYQSLPKEHIPQTHYALRDFWLHQIQQWNTAFDPVLLNYAADPSVHPLARPESIRLQTIILFLRIASTLQTPETVYDDMALQFDYLLSISEQVIAYESAHSDLSTPDFSSIDPELFPSPFDATETYTFEERIIPALYLIATKCRDSNLRHRAIDLLLSSRRREGIWDSILCGKVAQWMVGMEEEPVEEWNTIGGEWHGYVNEDRRVWGGVIERELQGRRAVVSCRRNIPIERGGGWREVSTVVEW